MEQEQENALIHPEMKGKRIEITNGKIEEDSEGIRGITFDNYMLPSQLLTM